MVEKHWQTFISSLSNLTMVPVFCDNEPIVQDKL